MKKSAFFLIKILSKFKNHQTYSYSRCYNFIRIQIKTTLKFSQMFLSHILMAEKKAKRVKQKKMKPSCFDTVGKIKANTYALHKCISQQFSYPIIHFHMYFHNCNMFM